MKTKEQLERVRERAATAAHAALLARAPKRIQLAPLEVVPGEALDRPLSPEELSMERDRIYARLTSVQNVTSRPSPSDYVVFEVADPDLVLRRLLSQGIPVDMVQKYPKIPNGMRVFVRTARRNEAFIRAIELAVK